MISVPHVTHCNGTALRSSHLRAQVGAGSEGHWELQDIQAFVLALFRARLGCVEATGLGHEISFETRTCFTWRELAL